LLFLATSYTLDDLDALLGFVAAEANHIKDRKLEKQLRAIFARLSGEMERYDGEHNEQRTGGT
jgi:hypothetical protein